MNFRILVMVKAPIPGIVKTRLMLPPQDAADLQAALIGDSVQKARALAPTTVAVAPLTGWTSYVPSCQKA